MPLPPDRFMELNKELDAAEKRFDEFLERRKINDAAEDEDEDEELPDPEEQLREPAEEALRNSPGSDLANPEFEEPWWYGHQ